jgi:hypothetical protein
MRSEPDYPLSDSQLKVLNRLRSLSRTLDSSITLPGTSYRIGLDPIIGLIPSIGDYIGAGLSAYIILEAAQFGTPQPILYRMVVNVILETIIGAIPILGDLFDATWKANLKNIKLLEAYLASPRRAQKVNWLFIGSLLFGLMLVVVCVTAFTVLILRLLFQAIGG